MTPVLKHRDPTSQAAAAELIQAAAQSVIDANSARTKALAAVAKKPSTALEALRAYQEYERTQAVVQEAEATYMAVLTLWGVSRHGLAAAVGCRPATITRRIGQHPLATARGCDLYRLPGGGWGVRSREPQAVDTESAPNARACASATEPVDHDGQPGIEPFDRESIDPAVLAAALDDVQRDLMSGGA